MTSKEVELQQLIKEQEQDMRYDNRVVRDRSLVSLTPLLEAQLSNEGFSEAVTTRERGKDRLWECAIHGREFIMVAPPSFQARGLKYRCRKCYNDRAKEWKLKHKERSNEHTRAYRQRKREAERAQREVFEGGGDALPIHIRPELDRTLSASSWRNNELGN